MPGSRHYRHHDDFDYDHDYDHDRDYSRGRDRARPRPYHRSSSYDDRYGRRQRSTRRYDVYSDDSDSDSDYDRVRRAPGRSKTRRSRRHTKSADDSRRRERSESRDWHEKMGQEKRNRVIRSALTAGAMEAVRQRNRPGDWLGARGMRVATAAMSAAAIDSAVDRNPRKSGKTKMVTSALGGLVVDKLLRGRR